MPSQHRTVKLIDSQRGQLCTTRMNLVSSSTGIDVDMALKNPSVHGYQEAFYDFTKKFITDL